MESGYLALGNADPTVRKDTDNDDDRVVSFGNQAGANQRKSEVGS